MIAGLVVGAATALSALVVNAGEDDGQLPRKPAYVWVVDMGAGLCTVTEIPGADGYRYMVYDAGTQDRFDRDRRCADFIKKVVRENSIDLLVVSHSHMDHFGNGDEVLKENKVSSIVRNGNGGGTNWEKKWIPEVAKEVAEDGAVDHSLKDTGKLPSTVLVGDATVSYVAGWAEPLDEWKRILNKKDDKNDLENVVSIVVRLEYGSTSVLFAGDTMGRRKGVTECGFAEAHMADKAIKSKVIVAPHHGSNGSSSTCFVKAVSPTYVVFSAGDKHRHPHSDAARRYIEDAGVDETNIYRTDCMDEAEKRGEWSHPKTGCGDPDHILITLQWHGDVSVDYRTSFVPIDAR